MHGQTRRENHPWTGPQSGPGPVPVQFGGYEHSTADSPPVMGNFGFDSTPPRRRHLLMISDSGAIPHVIVYSLCDGVDDPATLPLVSHQPWLGWRHFVPSDSVLVLYTFYYRSFFFTVPTAECKQCPMWSYCTQLVPEKRQKKKGRQGVVCSTVLLPEAFGPWGGIMAIWHHHISQPGPMV